MDDLTAGLTCMLCPRDYEGGHGHGHYSWAMLALLEAG